MKATCYWCGKKRAKWSCKVALAPSTDHWHSVCKWCEDHKVSFALIAEMREIHRLTSCSMTKRLLELAIQAQLTGKMPDLKGLR